MKPGQLAELPGSEHAGVRLVSWPFHLSGEVRSSTELAGDDELGPAWLPRWNRGSRGERASPAPTIRGARGEAISVGESLRARQLAEHLAVARAGDVELVEKRRDRLVVSREQLESLDRVVYDVDARF